MNNSLKELIKQIIEEAKDAELPIWSVYMLINSSKMEIYFGVSKDVDDRVLQHAKKKTKAIDHWVFESDKISLKILYSGLTQTEASKEAHGFELRYLFGIQGFNVIQTAGI